MINDQDKVNVSFSIVESGLENVDKVFNGFLKNVEGTKINYKNGLVKISIVGVGMRKARGVASRFFKAMESIPITLVTTSEIKISCLIPSEYKNKAVEILAKEFNL